MEIIESPWNDDYWRIECDSIKEMMQVLKACGVWWWSRWPIIFRIFDLYLDPVRGLPYKMDGVYHGTLCVGTNRDGRIHVEPEHIAPINKVRANL